MITGPASPVWHPFTQHATTPSFPEIARAEGAYLFDRDGHQIIDAISSWWVTTHGHCHPRIVAAIREAVGTLDQIIFANYTHAAAEQLARELIALTPAGLDHVFFSDSGSTSVEVALKMALGYWRNTGAPRDRILVLEHSYHGDTIGAMSVGARGVFNQAYEPLLFDVGTIPFPRHDNPQATLDALDDACRDKPAAFIVEPLVLGAGGMLMYGAETLAAMHEVCRRHDVLFIADEVMTGFGRTGTLFASEAAGIAPDIACYAKGLTGGVIPLAITLASSRIFDAHLSTDRSRMFFHSSSYTANPIACAAALANLAIWRDEPVLERIARLAEAQRQHLDELAKSGAVADPRASGTIVAFDITTARPGYLSDLAPRMSRFCHDRGVLLRPLGSTVYVMPAYCTTSEDLARVYDAIRAFIAEASA
ncbi:MAG: hypothetical protein RLZ98_326 [Pseudomonadota bacterium]|jgi:adenosylmethionine-8-amino-7-oxononanoate aminotransferase